MKRRRLPTGSDALTGRTRKASLFPAGCYFCAPASDASGNKTKSPVLPGLTLEQGRWRDARWERVDAEKPGAAPAGGGHQRPAGGPSPCTQARGWRCPARAAASLPHWDERCPRSVSELLQLLLVFATCVTLVIKKCQTFLLEMFAFACHLWHSLPGTQQVCNRYLLNDSIQATEQVM